MADKGLNLFGECAAKCVHLPPQEIECISSSLGDSEMYAPGTNGAIAKVRILVEQVIL